jgi:RecA/RadA recombinase
MVMMIRLAMLKEWISSGCDSTLDLAISNRPNGGFPVGRITEITGLEASGKSLLAAHTLAETQKKGGLSCLY